MNVVCDYCGQEAVKETGEQVYPHRPDLYSKTFYSCHPCGARIGCHPGTDQPLGRLANAQLRSAKMAAHSAFDPIWKSREMRRSEAYAWLSSELGIEKKDTHIGMFDVDMCLRVIEACKNRKTRGAS